MITLYLIIADLLQFIHILGLLILLFGFMLPKKYLKYYILLLPIVFISWLINNNICILTYYEYKLRNKNIENNCSSPFIYNTLKFMNINITQNQIDNNIHIIFIIPWVIAILRLLI